MSLFIFFSMEHLKIGNTTFNVLNMKDWTKEDFKKQYAGHLALDLDDSWELIQCRLKQVSDKQIGEVLTEQPKKNVRANKKSL